MNGTDSKSLDGDRSSFIPIIRMDSSDLDDIAKILRTACTDVGFFYLEGHGISKEMLDRVMDQSRKLFKLSRR